MLAFRYMMRCHYRPNPPYPCTQQCTPNLMYLCIMLLIIICLNIVGIIFLSKLKTTMFHMALLHKVNTEYITNTFSMEYTQGVFCMTQLSKNNDNNNKMLEIQIHMVSLCTILKNKI